MKVIFLSFFSRACYQLEGGVRRLHVRIDFDICSVEHHKLTSGAQTDRMHPIIKDRRKPRPTVTHWTAGVAYRSSRVRAGRVATFPLAADAALLAKGTQHLSSGKGSGKGSFEPDSHPPNRRRRRRDSPPTSSLLRGRSGDQSGRSLRSHIQAHIHIIGAFKLLGVTINSV